MTLPNSLPRSLLTLALASLVATSGCKTAESGATLKEAPSAGDLPEGQSHDASYHKDDALGRAVSAWLQLDEPTCDRHDDFCNKDFRSTEPTTREDADLGLDGTISYIPQIPDYVSGVAIDRDVTSILDDEFVSNLNGITCPAEKKALLTPYFTGIQGYDDNALDPRSYLGGDESTGDLYTKFALRSLDDNNSWIRRWMMLNFYNRPAMNRSKNPASIRGTGRNVPFVTYSYSRENHSSLRYPTRYANGRIAQWGDQIETRLLGIWASASPGDLLAHQPQFAGTQAATDRQDFADFYDQVANKPGFKQFMYKAAWHTGLAMKCGYRVYAHSGGGTVAGFALRLLGQRQDLAIDKWNDGGKLVLVGLEAVISEEMAKGLQDLDVYKDRLKIVNYVMITRPPPPTGSQTFIDPISAELRSIGHTALITAGVEGANPQEWHSDGPGHVGIGMYALRYGRLPKIFFP